MLQLAEMSSAPMHLAAGPADAALLPAAGPATGAGLAQAVAHVFGVPFQDILHSTRGKAQSARARQVLMYITHVACGMTLTEVGSRYNRDRTTVAHACGLIEDQRDDPAFDRALDLLELVAQAISSPRPADTADL